MDTEHLTDVARYRDESRFLPSTIVALELEKGKNAVAKWNVSLPDAVQNVIGLELQSVRIDEPSTDASASYLVLEFEGGGMGSLTTNTMVARSTATGGPDRTAGSEKGMVIPIGMFAPSDGPDCYHREYERAEQREYAHVQGGRGAIGSVRDFSVRVRAPLGAANRDAPVFSKMTLVLRFLTPLTTSARDMSYALHRAMGEEQVAGSLNVAGELTAARVRGPLHHF